MDKIMTDVIVRKQELEAINKKPRYIIVNKKLYEGLMEEFKDSLAYSELEYSFLSKVEQLEKEIGRHDLKISVGVLHDLHIVISDVVESNEFVIL